MASNRVKLNIEHAALGMSFRELSFPLDLTIGGLKDKLQMKVGSEPQNMELSLNGKLLDDDSQTLAEVGVSDSNCDLSLRDTDATSLANHVFDEPELPNPVVVGKADEGFRAFREQAKAQAQSTTLPSAAEAPAEVQKDDQDEI
jgi:hypothetical protein